MRSRIRPMKRVAKMLRRHHELILNWFRAKGTISSGVVEGLNYNAKLTMKKAYGFRTARGIKIALYHRLGAADAFEDFVNVAFAVKDVDQTRSLLGGEIVQGRLGRLDALQPLGTFLVSDRFLLALFGDGFGIERSAPVELMEQSQDQTTGLHGDGGMKMDSPRGVEVVQFAQSGGLLEGGVIDGGRVLNGEDGGQSAAGVQGGIDEWLEEMVDGEPLVFEEAVEGLGLTALAAGLGKGIEGFVGHRLQDEAEAAIESLVGEVGLPGNAGRPKFGRFQREREGRHP